MSSLTMDISKKDLLGMLSAYYSEKTGKEIKVDSKTETVLKGYGMGEHESADVYFYYKLQMDLLGTKVAATLTLSEEEIRTVLTELLQRLNYDVDRIDYKKGVRVTGSFRDEQEEAYFDGVSVIINQKGINKKL